MPRVTHEEIETAVRTLIRAAGQKRAAIMAWEARDDTDGAMVTVTLGNDVSQIVRQLIMQAENAKILPRMTEAGVFPVEGAEANQ